MQTLVCSWQAEACTPKNYPINALVIMFVLMMSCQTEKEPSHNQDKDEIDKIITFILSILSKKCQSSYLDNVT